MNGVFVALALLGGAALSFQVVLNTQLQLQMGSPMQATCVSLGIGTAAALGYCLVAHTPWPYWAALSAAPRRVWGGGLLGILYLWSTVVVAPRVGVAVTLGLVVAGQIVSSLLIDHLGVLGAPIHPATLGHMMGAMLVVAGVLLMTAFK